MGLDTVDLVMEFEDEFEISIPDEDAERLETLGQTVDYVMRRLQERPRRGVCLSAHAFYQLRRELAGASNLSFSVIRPETPLGSILTENQQRRRWIGIAQRCELPTPRLNFRHPFKPRCPEPDVTLRELVNTRHQRRIRYREDLDRETVWEKVKAITAKQARVDPDELHWDTHYINDLF